MHATQQNKSIDFSVGVFIVTALFGDAVSETRHSGPRGLSALAAGLPFLGSLGGKCF